MNWLLQEGAEMNFNGLNQPLRILRGIGSGSQGQVYAVAAGGETLALKWYLPSCVERDPQLRQRLSQSIRSGAPNADFLWPLAILDPCEASKHLVRHRDPSYGYLMALRPPSYQGLHLHACGDMEISIMNILRACFFLADGFHQLHLKGMCYKDISLGNLFLDPNTGRVLICDNDNVDIDGQGQGRVLGTPGFIAPEVLMGKSRPGATSDLYSLAVLLFRLLTRHDPFRGKLEMEIRCLDEPARRRLYGEDPVFIFDPNDTRNRPDPIEHVAALTTWPIYPPTLRKLFEQSFGVGLHQTQLRTLTGQWKLSLTRCLDQRQLCKYCREENFTDYMNENLRCWKCSGKLPVPLLLMLPCAKVIAADGNELHAHHFDPLANEDLNHPIGRIVEHPQDKTIIGLKNLSNHSWQARLHNSNWIDLEPGKICNLAALDKINCSAGSIILHTPLTH